MKRTCEGERKGTEDCLNAEERRMGGWRNETAATVEMIVHQPGWIESLGSFFVCFHFYLFVYFIFQHAWYTIL